MKNRRDILKAFVAGAAGVAGMGFVTKAKAEVVHSTGFVAAKKAKYPTEPVKFTKFGNLVFISGVAWSEGDVAEGMTKDQINTLENHVKVAMGKMKQALEEAGSSLTKIKRVTAWIDDINNYGPMNKVSDGYYPGGRRIGNRSCMTAVKGGIPGGSLVKYDCIATV